MNASSRVGIKIHGGIIAGSPSRKHRLALQQATYLAYSRTADWLSRGPLGSLKGHSRISVTQVTARYVIYMSLYLSSLSSYNFSSTLLDFHVTTSRGAPKILPGPSSLSPTRADPRMTHRTRTALCCLAHENSSLSGSRSHFITIRKPVGAIYAVAYGTLTRLLPSSTKNTSLEALPSLPSPLIKCHRLTYHRLCVGISVGRNNVARAERAFSLVSS